MAEYNGRFIPEHIRLTLPKDHKKEVLSKNTMRVIAREKNDQRWQTFDSVKEFLTDNDLEETTFRLYRKKAKHNKEETFRMKEWEIIVG